MKIEVYAVLKDYFDKEFTLDTPAVTIAELKQDLSERNNNAKDILQICRFAINDEFVDDKFELKPDDNISIIPPSSGG